MIRELATRMAVVGDTLGELAFRARHRANGLANDDMSPSLANIESAISRGLDFLAAVQRRDGAWTDFLLRPGASVEWITAHTAFVLEGVEQARSLTARAASYLVEAGHRNGGWGYNQRVAYDCDSTAQALLVLHAHGHRAPQHIGQWLLSAQTGAGGFPTYASECARTPRTGWHDPHGDVTLLVVEALRRLGLGHYPCERALEWLEASTAGPLVRSYWWPSPAYSAWSQARTGFRLAAAAARARDIVGRAADVPELAMLVAAAVHDEGFTTDVAGRAARILLAQQRGDGAWTCSPCLRVTEPSVASHSEELPGPIFAGERRVLSTAHAVAALNELAFGGRLGPPSPRRGDPALES
jgi:hypothetical protein